MTALWFRILAFKNGQIGFASAGDVFYALSLAIELFLEHPFDEVQVWENGKQIWTTGPHSGDQS